MTDIETQRALDAMPAAREALIARFTARGMVALNVREVTE